MIYILLITSIIAIVSASYVITFPVNIQKIYILTETESPDEVLDKLTIYDKLYLLMSMSGVVIVFLVFLADIPRCSLYGIILISTTIAGLVKKDFFMTNIVALRLVTIIELLIYIDVCRSSILQIV